MGTVEEFSAWLQFILMVGLLVMVYHTAKQFREVEGWLTLWVAFAVGFGGMVESRILVGLFAYGIETPWLRWIGRYVTPLQASIGLFIGMLLLTRFLRRMGALHGLIQLPYVARFVIDVKSRILAWDAGAEALFGWTAAEAIGEHFHQRLSPPRLQWQQIPIVERQMQQGGMQPFDARYTLTVRKRQAGEEFCIQVRLTTEPQADGSLQFRGIARRLMPDIGEPQP